MVIAIHENIYDAFFAPFARASARNDFASLWANTSWDAQVMSRYISFPVFYPEMMARKKDEYPYENTQLVTNMPFISPDKASKETYEHLSRYADAFFRLFRIDPRETKKPQSLYPMVDTIEVPLLIVIPYKNVMPRIFWFDMRMEKNHVVMSPIRYGPGATTSMSAREQTLTTASFDIIPDYSCEKVPLFIRGGTILLDPEEETIRIYANCREGGAAQDKSTDIVYVETPTSVKYYRIRRA